MTTFGMPSLLRGRSEGLGEDADPTEYAKVCVFGMGKRVVTRILTDADWPFASRHPVRQVERVLFPRTFGPRLAASGG
jgi:hypothetical protein